MMMRSCAEAMVSASPSLGFSSVIWSSIAIFHCPTHAADWRVGRNVYNRTVRGLLTTAVALMCAWVAGSCQVRPVSAQYAGDADGDGLSDALEQRLLQQFAPTFMVASSDCSGLPAEFAPNMSDPTVQRQNG